MPIIDKRAQREYLKKWRASNKERIRFLGRRQMLRRYGLTIEEFDSLLDAQGGVCAICRSPETYLLASGKDSRLSVDHCHETGVVRGLLCRSCNLVLGHLGDDVKLLEAAIEYLKTTGRGKV